jgi:hypothetical protein
LNSTVSSDLFRFIQSSYQENCPDFG